MLGRILSMERKAYLVFGISLGFYALLNYSPFNAFFMPLNLKGVVKKNYCPDNQSKGFFKFPVFIYKDNIDCYWFGVSLLVCDDFYRVSIL
jgi:hypothetical protein